MFCSFSLDEATGKHQVFRNATVSGMMCPECKAQMRDSNVRPSVKRLETPSSTVDMDSPSTPHLRSGRPCLGWTTKKKHLTDFSSELQASLRPLTSCAWNTSSTLSMTSRVAAQRATEWLRDFWDIIGSATQHQTNDLINKLQCMLLRKVCMNVVQQLCAKCIDAIYRQGGAVLSESMLHRNLPNTGQSSSTLLDPTTPVARTHSPNTCNKYASMLPRQAKRPRVRHTRVGEYTFHG